MIFKLYFTNMKQIIFAIAKIWKKKTTTLNHGKYNYWFDIINKTYYSRASILKEIIYTTQLQYRIMQQNILNNFENTKKYKIPKENIY